jgi:hypothetical protein
MTVAPLLPIIDPSLLTVNLLDCVVRVVATLNGGSDAQWAFFNRGAPRAGALEHFFS